MKVPSKMLQAITLGVLIVGALGAVVWSVASHFGAQEPFMPHAHCYLMIRELILLHGVSDFSIGAAYVAISGTLTYLVFRARREIPFHWMMLAFATFIVACGATHFMEVWTLTNPQPQYWLAGQVKLITAIASVATAVLLPPLIPKVLQLLREAQVSAHRKDELERANVELTSLYKKVSQLDELKTAFFANVSHELRTPLSLILGPVEQMLESGQTNGEFSRHLETVRRSARLLRKHVDDLLDVSKLEAGKMELERKRFNLSALVRIVADYFSSSNVNPLRFEVRAPDVIEIEADPEKVQRILLNLIANAFKFTPAGGGVFVSVEGKGSDALVVIEDTGPGVPPEMRDSIFERFQQGPAAAGRGGTGLGLAIAREFAELHQGSLTVTAAPEHSGACFTLRLPRLEIDGGGESLADNLERFEQVRGSHLRHGETMAPTANLPVSQVGTDLSEGKRPRVLIAEDNREMAELIATSLREDCDLTLASNGKEAVEAMENDLPDLLLTDLMMPEMSGDQLLEEVRRRHEWNNVPVLLLTAKADDEVKLKLLERGAQDYLIKPFAIQELRARVRNQIATKQVRDTLQRELASQENDISRLALEVTQRARELERAKRVAEEANRAKDQFLAVLSHELRTPLTPVLALASDLESQETVSPEELKDAVRLIRRNIELEAHLIDDLLDLTRISKGKLKIEVADVDVHEAIKSALEMCEVRMRERHARIDLRLDATPSFVRADAARLLQVIWNLLLNAIKFSPENGRITVRTVRIGQSIVISVEDNGTGIAPEIIGRIFEPFEQGESSAVGRRHGGLGVGLAVVRGLIEAQSGRVGVESEGPGKGARFWVELPAAMQESIAPGVTHDVSDRIERSMRILLVEDHDDTRSVTLRLLERWGHRVEESATLADACQKLQSAEFDILVSDLGLPDGHGTELMEIARQKGIRGIAMSGFGMEEDLQRSKNSGFDYHLIKPVGAQKLKATLALLALSISAAS